MKESQLNTYNVSNFMTVREKVYQYVRANQGLDADQIMNGLGISIKNSGRLTELEQAGYVYTIHDKNKNKSLYYAKDPSKLYNMYDFNSKKQKRVAPEKKLADAVGFYLVQLKNDKLSIDQKKQLVNDFLKVYSTYLFMGKKEDLIISEIKVLQIKLGQMLNIDEFKID